MPNEPENTVVQEEAAPVEQEAVSPETEAAASGEETAAPQEPDASEAENKPARDLSKLIDVAVYALLALAVGIGIFVGITTYSYLNEVAAVRAIQAQRDAAEAGQPQLSGHAYSGPALEYVPNDWPASSVDYAGPETETGTGTAAPQDSRDGQVVDSPGLSELTEPVDDDDSAVD